VRTGVRAYVLSSNRLAGEFLVQVLAKDRFTEPILCEELPQPRSGVPIVFVVDGSYVPVSLRECVRRLRSLFPKARCVVVSAPRPDEHIASLLTLGVQAFVEQSDVVTHLHLAIRAVCANGFWISDEVFRRPRTNHQLPTAREGQVLELVRQGLSNKEIAATLKLHLTTVGNHISSLLAKFDVKNRRGLEFKDLAAPVWQQLHA
jgi:DNA-binding NarL/FixJ family response regulator